jgi:hypothetical protein
VTAQQTLTEQLNEILNKDEITLEDIADSAVMQQIANEWVDRFTGTNTFMRSIAGQKRRGKNLTYKQLLGALNNMRQVLRPRKAVPVSKVAETQTKLEGYDKIEGEYDAWFNGELMHCRIVNDPSPDARYRQVCEFKAPNGHWVKFAYLNEGRKFMFGKYKLSERIQSCLRAVDEVPNALEPFVEAEFTVIDLSDVQLPPWNEE